MGGHLQTTAESSQAPLKVALDRGDLRVREFGHFTERPAETVDQDNGDALTVRELAQEEPECRLAPRLGLLGPSEDRPNPSRARAALADSEKVSDGIRELLNMWPVLPRVGQRLGGGLTSALGTEHGDEGTT
jgi:hypothetical protein